LKLDIFIFPRDNSSNKRNQGNSMDQKVVIIGIGPTGLLLAHYLLRRGQYRVELYEQRPDPRSTDVSQDRTFPLSLQERGRKALRQIPGLEEAIAADSVFCTGTKLYPRKGKPREFPRSTPILTIDRNRLVFILLQQLTQTYDSEQIIVKFGCQYVGGDRQAKTVTLQPEQGEAFTVAYDRLVAADGARSQIRDKLAGELQCEQNYIPDAYKSVFLSRVNPALGVELEADKIHGANRDIQTRMVMVPQPGDRLNGVIIFGEAQNPFSSLTTPEAVLNFFQTEFPVFGQLMSLEDAAALWQRPVGRVLTVRCDRFHQDDSILLIGDAAHAVSPTIGQGCNASLEDVLIFERLLEQHDDDWAQALPMFSEQRVPDAHALQELSSYSFPRSKWLIIEYYLRLKLHRVLHQWFPKWVKPFIFDLVLDYDLPYSQILSFHQGWVNRVKRSVPSM
jgi:kynurenine 3-monooxygenase